MAENPYQAPNAPVADAIEATAPRPASVTAALVLIAIAALLTGIQIASNFSRMYNGEMSALDLLLQILAVAALVVAGFQLFKRHGWARWLLLVLALWRVVMFCYALSVFSRMYGGMFPYLGSTIASIALVPVLLAIAAYLVLVPARAWFART